MNDAMRYQRLCDSGLPLCFEGREYAGKAELDAAIDATLQPYRRKKPISADFVMKPGWSRLLHAAFHLMDDSCEDAQTGQISIDNQIGAADLKELMQALGELGIGGHDDLSTALAAAPMQAAPEWQPIATAPKTLLDLKTVELLGHCPESHEMDPSDQVDVRVIWWEPHKNCWWCDGDFRVQPSHWMPLPAAPATAPKGESL